MVVFCGDIQWVCLLDTGVYASAITKDLGTSVACFCVTIFTVSHTAYEMYKWTAVSNEQLNVNGEDINLSEAVEYLGVYLDSLKQHILYKCRMAMFNIHQI